LLPEAGFFDEDSWFINILVMESCCSGLFANCKKTRQSANPRFATQACLMGKLLSYLLQIIDKMIWGINMNKRIDKLLYIDILILVAIGLLMVYSASNVVAKFKYNDAGYYFKRQLLFACLGLIGMHLAMRINIMTIKKYTSWYFFIALLLLILVLIPGIGIVRGGARSWIGFGNFSIQPAEVMTLTVMLLLAKFLSEHALELSRFFPFLVLLLIIGIIFALIILQPDFGTGLVIVASSILLLFLSGAPLKYFIFLLLVGLLGVVALIISAPYRIERILAFVNPWQDPLGSGFQGIQSLFAIAPSGLFGLGYNNSMQKHFFLPEPQNDFIFAIIVEELGLIGGAFVIGLYFFIFYKTVKISVRVKDRYLMYVALGMGLSLFVQVFVNISVVVGLLPVTGITLPIISYGGSSLIFTLISLGILLNVSQYQEVI